MKTHGHYQTLSAIKQMRKLVDYMVGGKVKSRKVRRVFIKGAKKVYRKSRPKRTRYIYEN